MVEREDASEIAFVDVAPASEGGAPQAAAVEDVGKSALNVFAAFFKQGFSLFGIVLHQSAEAGVGFDDAAVKAELASLYEQTVGAQAVQHHLMRGLEKHHRQALAEDHEAGVIGRFLGERITQKAEEEERVRATGGDAPVAADPLQPAGRKGGGATGYYGADGADRAYDVRFCW